MKRLLTLIGLALLSNTPNYINASQWQPTYSKVEMVNARNLLLRYLQENIDLKNMIARTNAQTKQMGIGAALKRPTQIQYDSIALPPINDEQETYSLPEMDILNNAIAQALSERFTLEKNLEKSANAQQQKIDTMTQKKADWQIAHPGRQYPFPK